MNLEDDPVIDDQEIDNDNELDNEPDDDQELEPVVSFGDEGENDDTGPDVPRRLRNQIKDRDRELIALKRRNEELEKKAAPAPVDVGPRPKLADFDYDDENPAYLKATEEYEDRKVQAAIQKQAPGDDDGLIDEAIADGARMEAGLAALAFPDAKDVVSSVGSAMSGELQYAIASNALDPAMFVYAIGKHPAKLQELLAIKNRGKQIAAVVRMEASMKVGNSRKAPEPDRPQRGNASASLGSDKELARLEASAEKSGDRSEVAAYKRRLKAA